MTSEENKYFTALNKQWERLKPYVNDEATYKKIMQDLIMMFFHNMPAEFTSEWWNKVIDSFFEYSKQYRTTDYKDFSSELAMAFLNYWELLYKFTCKENTFDEIMKSVFDKEIERIGTVRMEE